MPAYLIRLTAKQRFTSYDHAQLKNIGHRVQKAIYHLVQNFLGGGINREQRDANGNTAVLGYVAVQPRCDGEYPEEGNYPDLDEPARGPQHLQRLCPQ